MIRLKRAWDPAEPSDGYRVLVDRLWPRGVRKEELVHDRWMKELAPSTALRKWFGHDPDRWEEFGRRYREELRSQTDALDLLRQKSEEGALTLVYGARDRERNQAVVLREVLGERGA